MHLLEYGVPTGAVEYLIGIVEFSECYTYATDTSPLPRHN